MELFNDKKIEDLENKVLELEKRIKELEEKLEKSEVSDPGLSKL